MRDFILGMLYGGAAIAILAYIWTSYDEFRTEVEELAKEEEERMWLEYLCENEKEARP